MRGRARVTSAFFRPLPSDELSRWEQRAAVAADVAGAVLSQGFSELLLVSDEELFDSYGVERFW